MTIERCNTSLQTICLYWGDTVSEISDKIGNQIRIHRNNLGLSQEELAFKADLNVSFLGQIERGKKKPTIDTIEKIVTALNITYQELFSFENSNETPIANGTINKIVFELNSLSEDEQESIYQIVKKILKLRDRK